MQVTKITKKEFENKAPKSTSSSYLNPLVDERPLYEWQCSDCGDKVKSSMKNADMVCKCNGRSMKKLGQVKK